MFTIPRPRKHRRIGFHPRFSEYGPNNGPCDSNYIVLKIEELESIRLMDLENKDQQACAEQMEIGRSTFQRIYKNAREKIADSLINGKRLIIEANEEQLPKGNGKCHRNKNS